MKKCRIAASVLAAAVLFILVCSPFVIAFESRHDCCGEGCPVCAMIAACTEAWIHLTHAVAAAAVCIPLAAAAICLSAGKSLRREGYDRSRNGIRLLN